MKKLIKFLFPKTYQAIFDDGYTLAYNVYNNYEGEDDDDYDYQQYDFDNEYYEHELEMQNLHDEYHAELVEEYEQECRKAEQFLAEIYNPKPPALEVGDKIHLHSKQGMYTVTEVYNDSFAYRTRDSIDDAYANYDDYKCHAGGRWN